jgi:hypothetical protein
MAGEKLANMAKPFSRHGDAGMPGTLHPMPCNGFVSKALSRPAAPADKERSHMKLPFGKKVPRMRFFILAAGSSHNFE